MTFEEAEQPGQQTIPVFFFSEELDWHRRSRDDCQRCLDAVPKPPSGYVYSDRQVLRQMQYFHKKQDQVTPDDSVDLFDATIVALRK